MRIALAAFIALHGLVHLLGPVKAFGWANVNQLRSSISHGMGLVWLLAAVLLVVGAASLALRAAWWWYPTLVGLILSQGLIVSAWSDAKFGTIANVIILIPLMITALDTRSSSFSSRFAHDRSMLLAQPPAPATLVSENDLTPLPPLMQKYLRNMGVVGRESVRNVQVTFKAQMRSSVTSPWMESTATQYESFSPPARLFHMNASRAGLPFDVFHRYVGDSATFQVRIVGLISMVNKSGAGLTHDETVTLMNDILVMAPAAALDLPFTFETTGAYTLRATFRNAGYTVASELTFDEAGDLVGFHSADRAHDREGGAAIWSTPISGYQLVDGIRVGTLGDANWIDATGEWTYGRFQITSIAYNVTR